MGSENTFSVVVPTYGRHSRLGMLLESLSQAVLPAALAEIVVVENGERHGAAEVCRQWGARLPVPVRYFYAEESSAGNARNIGAHHATGNWVVFFDDDVRVEQECLLAYDRAFSSLGAQGFMGGRVVPEYEATPEFWLMPFLPPSAAGLDLGSEAKSAHDAVFIGPNMAVARRCFEEGYEFDPNGPSGYNMGLLGDETRLQQRLLDRGIVGLYVPDAVVHHYVPRNRCSIPWLRQRSYRAGCTGGFYRETANEPSLAGVPRWIWRVRLLALARLAGTNLLTRNREIRLRAALKSDYARGLVDGVRMKRVEDVTDLFA